jgi:hypothetical protein
MNPVAGCEPPPAVPVRLPIGGGGEADENWGGITPASPAPLTLKINRSEGRRRSIGRFRPVGSFPNIEGSLGAGEAERALRISVTQI